MSGDCLFTLGAVRSSGLYCGWTHFGRSYGCTIGSRVLDHRIDQHGNQGIGRLDCGCGRSRYQCLCCERRCGRERSDGLCLSCSRSRSPTSELGVATTDLDVPGDSQNDLAIALILTVGESKAGTLRVKVNASFAATIDLRLQAVDGEALVEGANRV